MDTDNGEVGLEGGRGQGGGVDEEKRGQGTSIILPEIKIIFLKE